MHEQNGDTIFGIYHGSYFQLTFDLVFYQLEVKYIFLMHLALSEIYDPIGP